MRVLPYRRFTIDSPLAPAQVQARLRGAIAQKWTFGFTQPDQPLVGDFDGRSFNVTRYVRSRNSFRPQVRGTIEPLGTGTRLVGKMQLHELAIVFIGFFAFVAGSVFLSGAARSIASRQLEPAMLVALGVIAFLTAMTFGGFAMEVRSSLDDLAKVVDASHAEMR